MSVNISTPDNKAAASKAARVQYWCERKWGKNADVPPLAATTEHTADVTLDAIDAETINKKLADTLTVVKHLDEHGKLDGAWKRKLRRFVAALRALLTAYNEPGKRSAVAEFRDARTQIREHTAGERPQGTQSPGEQRTSFLLSQLSGDHV